MKGRRPLNRHRGDLNRRSSHLKRIFFEVPYRVFQVRREAEHSGDAIAFFQSIGGKVLVIFDDVLKFKSLIKSVINIGRNDIKILVTARSALLETAKGAVTSRLGNASFVEIDLNFPPKDEIESVIRYLDENGLLGEYVELNHSERKKFIERTCGGQIRDIILALFETGALHERVVGILDNIQNLNAEAQRITIFSALLTMAGAQQWGSLNTVADLVDYKGSFEDLRNEYIKHEIIGLVKIEQDELVFKSPALAEFVLKRATRLSNVLEIIKMTLFRVDKYFNDDDDFGPLSRSLLRYSHYGKLVKGKDDTALIEKFYDDCRVLSVARKEPLFFGSNDRSAI